MALFTPSEELCIKLLIHEQSPAEIICLDENKYKRKTKNQPIGSALAN